MHKLSATVFASTFTCSWLIISLIFYTLNLFLHATILASDRLRQFFGCIWSIILRFVVLLKLHVLIVSHRFIVVIGWCLLHFIVKSTVAYNNRWELILHRFQVVYFAAWLRIGSIFNLVDPVRSNLRWNVWRLRVSIFLTPSSIGLIIFRKYALIHSQIRHL